MKGIGESAHKQSTQLPEDKKALSKLVHTKSSSVMLLTQRCITPRENTEGREMKHDLLKDELASLYWVPCEISVEMICCRKRSMNGNLLQRR